MKQTEQPVTHHPTWLGLTLHSRNPWSDAKDHISHGLMDPFYSKHSAFFPCSQADRQASGKCC